MHKEELINLHQMLYDVKVYFETLNPEPQICPIQRIKDHPLPAAQEQDGAQTCNLCTRNGDCQRDERCGLLLIKQDISTHEGTRR